MGESALLVEPADARGVLPLYTRLRAAAPAWAVELVPAAATVLVVFDRRRVGMRGVESWVRATAAGGSGEREAGARGTPALDTGARDTRSFDTGARDTRSLDTGARDTGARDTRAFDTGARDTEASDTGARHVPSVSDSVGQPQPIELPVTYDGPDLLAVAELTGLGVEGVIRAHTAAVWVSAFIGFAPGFAYLSPEGAGALDGDTSDAGRAASRPDVRRLDVPRRAVPRTVVPAGSVALAAGYCGVYPRESPGGWQLIGRTDAVLWDPSRPHPALLAPGTRVRFVRAE